MVPRVAAAALAVVAATHLASCSCTLIGCVSGLQLTFDPIALGDSDVVFAMTGPELSVSARCAAAGCESLDAVGGDLSVVPDAASNTVASVDLYWYSADRPPTTVTLSVTRDGQVIGQAVVSSITYDETYPNGERCDDHPCYQAERAITLAAP